MVAALEIVISLASLLLVVLILLHRGKGGGLSDMFGGGFTSNFSGSSVVERNLDRLTLVTVVVWIAAIIALLFMLK
jgi:preprotein translocase subunit SecG